MNKSKEEWAAILSPDQFNVLVEKETESPFTGKYTSTPPSNTGVYECVACSNPLYKALTKFISYCGWPAFYEAIPGSIYTCDDKTYGMTREELCCTKCGGHLGHLFKGEGYKTPTNERHCVNSVCLSFNPEKKSEQNDFKN